MTPIQETIINKKTNNSPIWLMRQAGRYLPEFREIRKLNPDFINLCLNDDLCSKITLQPLKRFDLSAAIIFSDILMVPYGLKQKVNFKKIYLISGDSGINYMGVDCLNYQNIFFISSGISQSPKDRALILDKENLYQTDLVY